MALTKIYCQIFIDSRRRCRLCDENQLQHLLSSLHWVRWWGENAPRLISHCIHNWQDSLDVCVRLLITVGLFITQAETLSYITVTERNRGIRAVTMRWLWPNAPTLTTGKERDGGHKANWSKWFEVPDYKPAEFSLQTTECSTIHYVTFRGALFWKAKKQSFKEREREKETRTLSVAWKKTPPLATEVNEERLLNRNWGSVISFLYMILIYIKSVVFPLLPVNPPVALVIFSSSSTFLQVRRLLLLETLILI